MTFSFKSLLLSLILMLFCLGTQAQANLEFNQVLYQSLSGSAVNSGTKILATTTLTVPAGKIWKITSARARWTVSSVFLGGNCSSDPIGLYLDDVEIFYSALTTSNYPIFDGVIWLPPGTYTLELRGYNCSSGTIPGAGFITVMEFNVVP